MCRFFPEGILTEVSRVFELSNVHDAQTTMKAASGRQRVNPPQGYHLHRSGIIRVSEQLLKKDPSEKEEQAAQEMLR